MVYLSTKTVGGEKRFFLVKSIRIGGKVEKISISLGSKKPGMEKIKLLSEIAEPKFCLEEATLKAEHTSKKYKSEYIDEKKIKKIEFTRHFYKSYLHRLKPSELEKYRQNFLVRYAFNTTNIEGNSTTLPETALILLKKIAPEGRELREIYEIENYGKLVEFMDSYGGELTKKFILKVHEILLSNIDDNAGKFRKIRVHIIGSEIRLSDPKDIETKISELIEHYNRSDNLHPFELVSVLHHMFEKIHPFSDGNGRVGRELINFVLKKKGYPPLVIEVKRRQRYIKALMKADSGEIEYLIDFITETFLEQYDHLTEIDIDEINKKIEDVKS